MTCGYCGLHTHNTQTGGVDVSRTITMADAKWVIERYREAVVEIQNEWFASEGVTGIPWWKLRLINDIKRKRARQKK